MLGRKVFAPKLFYRFSLEDQVPEGHLLRRVAAAVDFAFEATMEDGSTRQLVLDGRIMLDPVEETWRIFGYDVTFDDGVAVDAESEEGS